MLAKALMDATGLSVARGVGVDECGGQFGHGVGEGVFGVVRDAVGIGEAGGGVDVEFGVGVQPVSDPAHLHAAHPGDAGFGGQRGFGGVDEFGVDAVHEAAEHVAHGGAQDGEDGDGDEQPDDGVGQREAQRDAAGAEEHGQRGESVGAGVQSVGDQGGRADLAADADAVDGDEFVADESDQPGGGDPAEVLDRDGVDQAADRFDPGDRRPTG